MTLIDHFLLCATQLQGGLSIPESTLSHRVFGDTKRLKSLRSGSTITVRKLREGVFRFRDHWPESLIDLDLVSLIERIEGEVTEDAA